MPERRARLQRWVQNGGRLVVLPNMLSQARFTEWSGVTQDRKKELRKDREPKKCIPAPAVPCPPPSSSPVEEPGKAVRQWNICNLPARSFLTTSRRAAWRLNDTEGHT